LVAGPLWDFDQAAGGSSDGGFTNYGPSGVWAAEDNAWFKDLMAIPEFRQLVSVRWKEIRDREVREMINEARRIAEIYEACFIRNFTVPGYYRPGDQFWRVPPSVTAIRTYMGQVDYLINWFELRIVWMDGFLQ